MKLKLTAIIALALASSASIGAAEKLTTSTINVYSATPLPSLGLPLNIIPANIQIATPKAINAQSGVSLADYMSTNMQSVSVTEMGGNPWQPEVTFRGYSASPLLGMPQGMSTYVDGVRVNEPFGDVTLWDKIPNFAIGGMQLVPGSNPMYGLNTLGGAIAIQTKSGRQAQGVGIETEYGSWNRKRALVEYGGVSKDGSMDFYIGHQTTKEDGWRQFSPSHLNQTFAKTGWQSEKTKLDLSYIGTDNKLIGNGFTPEHLLSGDRDQIHTRPDWTNNYYHHLALNGSHWINNDVMLSGNTYWRKSNRHTKNGDLYEYEIDGTEEHDIYDIDCNEAAGDECELKGSVLNTSHTKQDNYGVSAQMTFNQDLKGMKNQLIVGTGFDYSLIRFRQNERVNISSESEGDFDGAGIDSAGVGPAALTASVFDPSRESILTGGGALPQTQTVGLTGKQWTASLFATDTLSLNDKWHLNAGVRYNHTKVDNNDSLRGAYVPVTNERSLTATDDYKRLNPTIGITHTPTDKLSIFGTYSESSRAPTSIELGCSNPEVGCLLPSAMADDPPLKQVVAKTYDFGARGSLTDEVKWNASIYHAMNHQDIQFIRVDGSSSRGYYSNVGRTQRQGLDLGLSGQLDRFRWSSSYSYIRATFDSDFTLLSGSNSSSDVADNYIEIKKGNRMPSIPEHQLKARAQYDVTPQWSVGTNLVYFSDQFVMGNENNKHAANTAGCSNGTGAGGLEGNDFACGSGKIKDYTVVNLDTQYNFGGGWKAFAKAINIFDNDYYVAGRLAETMFDASGAYGGEIKSRGLIPGAPRAAWIGVRYEFGGAPDAK
jgi:outer membrane receptor protein involved in Fe transport